MLISLEWINQAYLGGEKLLGLFIKYKEYNKKDSWKWLKVDR